VKIITLVENTAANPDCIAEHGLCLYIETKKHKLLLDTGASEALLHNAKVLGIDLAQVDTVILSHGHYDHSGGLLAFAALNPDAKIYMQRTALEDYYHGERYIGIDKRIAALPGLQLLDGNFTIDEELSLFTNITGRRFWPQSNIGLTKRVPLNSGEKQQAPCAYKLQQDQFDHEQCLVLTLEEGNVLLSGCAHNGILNLLERYEQLYNGVPQLVISGFHMMKKDGTYTAEETTVIRETASELSRYESTLFYTGHCTGLPAFDLMKPILGDRLQPLQTGTVIP